MTFEAICSALVLMQRCPDGSWESCGDPYIYSGLTPAQASDLYNWGLK